MCDVGTQYSGPYKAMEGDIDGVNVSNFCCSKGTQKAQLQPCLSVTIFLCGSIFMAKEKRDVEPFPLVLLLKKFSEAHDHFLAG